MRKNVRFSGLFTLALLLIGWSQNNFGQSSCSTALSYPGPNLGISDTIQAVDSLCWIGFTADSAAVSISIDSISGLNYTDIQALYLYAGSCQNPQVLDSNLGYGENPTMRTLYSNQLTPGQDYFIKLLLNPDSTAFLSLQVKSLRISTYSWNEDLECPNECNIIRNSRFNINYFNNDFGDATSEEGTINYSPIAS